METVQERGMEETNKTIKWGVREKHYFKRNYKFVYSVYQLGMAFLQVFSAVASFLTI